MCLFCMRMPLVAFFKVNSICFNYLIMSFWNFIGGFAIFNAICDLFSSRPKQTNISAKSYDINDYHNDYLSVYDSESIESMDADELQDYIDDLQLRQAETDVLSDRWDELQDRIDELQERIDLLDDIDDLREKLDDLEDELDDLELDRDLYDDFDD